MGDLDAAISPLDLIPQEYRGILRACLSVEADEDGRFEYPGPQKIWDQCDPAWLRTHGFDVDTSEAGRARHQRALDAMLVTDRAPFGWEQLRNKGGNIMIWSKEELDQLTEEDLVKLEEGTLR